MVLHSNRNGTKVGGKVPIPSRSSCHLPPGRRPILHRL